MAEETYSIAVDFVALTEPTPDLAQLDDDVNKSAITEPYQGTWMRADVFKFFFDNPLGAPDKAILDGIVAAHTGIENPSRYGGTGGIPVDTVRAPTANDDSSMGFATGSIWCDNSVEPCAVYISTKVDVGAAVWERIELTNKGLIKRVMMKATDLESPVNADWTVNALAPVAADSNNNGISVRLFDDSTEEGVGFSVLVPATALNMKLTLVARAETAPGAAEEVALHLYERGVADNGAPQPWSSAIQLANIAIQANENFQYDTEEKTLITWGLTGGQWHQFELTRDTADVTDTLAGDWALLLLVVEFS